MARFESARKVSIRRKSLVHVCAKPDSHSSNFGVMMRVDSTRIFSRQALTTQLPKRTELNGTDAISAESADNHLCTLA